MAPSKRWRAVYDAIVRHADRVADEKRRDRPAKPNPQTKVADRLRGRGR